MTRATIVEVSDGKHTLHRVMLGGHEIGTSKTSFDAQFHMNAINDAIDVAYLEGQKTLERQVARDRLEQLLETQKQKLRAEVEEQRAAIMQVGEHWK